MLRWMAKHTQTTWLRSPVFQLAIPSSCDWATPATALSCCLRSYRRCWSPSPSPSLCTLLTCRQPSRSNNSPAAAIVPASAPPTTTALVGRRRRRLRQLHHTARAPQAGAGLIAAAKDPGCPHARLVARLTAGPDRRSHCLAGRGATRAPAAALPTRAALAAPAPGGRARSQVQLRSGGSDSHLLQPRRESSWWRASRSLVHWAWTLWYRRAPPAEATAW
jgi:hypothetical protein